MAIAYTPPGVTVEELTSPSVSPLLALPALIGLVGLAQNYVERTDLIAMQHAGTTFPNLPSDASLLSVQSVRDSVDPGNQPVVSNITQGSYRLTNDYTVSLSSHTITRVDAADVGAGVGDGLIPEGRICYVTYRYLPSDYFNAVRLDSLGSVAQRFGPTYDSSGAIASHLTLAASLAFENGARTVVCQPLFSYNTPGDSTTAKVAPVIGSAATAKATSNANTWADTFYGLRDIEDINVFVPVVGQDTTEQITDAAWLAIAQTAQDHLVWLQTSHRYAVVLLAEDSTDSTTGSPRAQKATIENHADILRQRYNGDFAQDVVLINTAKFSRANPSTTGSVDYIGGQYVVAAISGMLASRPVQAPLTRKQISGIQAVVDYRSGPDEIADAQDGLLVITMKGQAVLVKHAVTLDNTSTITRELSVIRSKHYMIGSLIDTLEENIVGQIVADNNAPLLIQSAVVGVLDAVRAQGAIVDYANVQIRQLAGDPTVFEVRFSFKPAVPVNYIHVAFSVDLTGVGITSVGATA